MIGKLKGIIDTLNEDGVIIDVNGVGYIVHCSSQTISNLAQGITASLLIETVVKEDSFELFGFASAEEKFWFKKLTKISGVGPRMCLSILSAMRVDEIQIAISAQDKAAFKRASGVGPKLAERIVIELKSVVAKMGIPNVTPISSNSKDKKSGDKNLADGSPSQKIFDASSALEKFGYQKSDVFSVVHRLANEDESADLQTLIKKGLKELSGIK